MKNRGVINADQLVIGGVFIRLEAGYKHRFLGVQRPALFEFVYSYLSPHTNWPLLAKVA
jgi:hypothetical protein